MSSTVVRLHSVRWRTGQHVCQQATECAGKHRPRHCLDCSPNCNLHPQPRAAPTCSTLPRSRCRPGARRLQASRDHTGGSLEKLGHFGALSLHSNSETTRSSIISHFTTQPPPKPQPQPPPTPTRGAVEVEEGAGRGVRVLLALHVVVQRHLLRMRRGSGTRQAQVERRGSCV